MADSYRELLSGYGVDVAGLSRTFPSDGFGGVLTIGPIPFSSLCRHHFLPFTGDVTVRYVPSGRVLGLSKFSRVVSAFARRAQTQERLTQQVVDALEGILAPRELSVTVTAEHFCMRMRGVQQSGVRTITVGTSKEEHETTR